VTLKCSDCGKDIYASDEEESVGGKHAVVWDDSGSGLVTRFICLPCSEKYEDITPEMQGVREEAAKIIEEAKEKSK
jgi:hypothetical protein